MNYSSFTLPHCLYTVVSLVRRQVRLLPAPHNDHTGYQPSVTRGNKHKGTGFIDFEPECAKPISTNLSYDSQPHIVME